MDLYKKMVGQHERVQVITLTSGWHPRPCGDAVDTVDMCSVDTVDTVDSEV